MTKAQMFDSVQKHYEMVRAGYVAAIAAAAEDPNPEALRNIGWYEERLDALGILRLKVEANIEEDSHL
jgi:hypothetical protein